jgi:integrase
VSRQRQPRLRAGELLRSLPADYQTVSQQPPPAGLLEQLLAAVRAEFRVEVLVPKVGDPIFSGPPCVVGGCDRAGEHQETGLCRGHAHRWRKQGRPDLATFIVTTSPRTYGRGPVRACTVSWCRCGLHGPGLCGRHTRMWQLAGQPELARWVAGVVCDRTGPQPICRLPGCELWRDANSDRQPFCSSHMTRWHAWRHRTGGSDIAEFIDFCATHGVDVFDLRQLPPQLKLELQYVLQCRADARRGKLRPRDVGITVRFLAASGALSLLSWPQEIWDARFCAFIPSPSRGYSLPLALLRYAHQRVEDLAYGQGWETEFPKDVWELRRLGYTTGPPRLRFDRIPQLWLRQLAKRWIRWRLTTGTSTGHAAKLLRNLNAFAGFLAVPTVQVAHPTELTRDVLERYAAMIASQPWAARTRGGCISTVQMFLHAVRQHRWDDGQLPAGAAFYPEDHPERPKLAPRFLSEVVMAQIEDRGNLARMADPTSRLLTLILIRTGLRVGDGSRLKLDCIVHDAQGAPYLHYRNHKLKREGLVPIDDELVDKIEDQQERVRQRWPDPSLLLPRQTANPDGRWPLSPTTYRNQLLGWLEACDIRDQAGRRAHITPHQWRHTFGTRLINLDVPQEVVRKLLDHESHQMTGHYARLHDQTVRRHWERARKVNIAGEEVRLDPGSPLAEAAWMTNQVARAKQSLPNGYCGLPLQQTCPHANACLTCPVFISTPEFLPAHHEQRGRTLQLIAAAEAKGQTRMVEMNRQVLTNLDRMIAKLEADDGSRESADAG